MRDEAPYNPGGDTWNAGRALYECKCGFTSKYVEEFGDHRVEMRDDAAHFNVNNTDPDYNQKPLAQADGDPGTEIVLDGEPTGVVLRPPEPGWHLLLDYDRAQDVPGWVDSPRGGPPSAADLHTVLAKRLERAGYEVAGHVELDESTNGWHAKVKLRPPPKSPIEVVALQAICGSDPLREACNMQRAREVQAWIMDGLPLTRTQREGAEFWSPRWNVLYAPNADRKRVGT